MEFQHTKKDDRRNKDYFRKTSVTEFLCIKAPSSYVGSSTYSLLKDGIKARLPVNTGPKYIVRVDSSYRRDDMWTVSIGRKWKAEKPSLIISEEEAEKDFGLTLDEIANLFAEVKANAEEVLTREAAQEKAVADAEHLIKHVISQVKGKARDTCRVEQRLAAIRAEVRAEYLVALEKEKDEWMEEIRKWRDEGNCNDQTVELCEKHLMTVCKAHKPGLQPRFLDNLDTEVKQQLQEARQKEKGE